MLWIFRTLLCPGKAGHRRGGDLASSVFPEPDEVKASRIVVADRGSVRLERDEADDPVVVGGFRTRTVHDLDRLVGLGVDDIEEEAAPGGTVETAEDRDLGDHDGEVGPGDRDREGRNAEEELVHVGGKHAAGGLENVVGVAGILHHDGAEPGKMQLNVGHEEFLVDLRGQVRVVHEDLLARVRLKVDGGDAAFHDCAEQHFFHGVARSIGDGRSGAGRADEGRGRREKKEQVFHTGLSGMLSGIPGLLICC